MARNKDVERKNDDSALVTESMATGNPNLKRAMDGLAAGFKPHRNGKSFRTTRIERTGMFYNPKPVWAYTKNEDGSNKDARLVFPAGWYLSVEEQAVRDKILDDPENQDLNDRVHASMENAGLVVEKRESQVEAKVVG